MAIDTNPDIGSIRNRSTELYRAFVYPSRLSALDPTAAGLKGEGDILFGFADANPNIVDFMEPLLRSDSDLANLAMYNAPNSTEIYRNFLDWLFATFDESEEAFRSKLIDHLRLHEGMKVLITGCGLGEDIRIVRAAVGPIGEIHAQDISRAMVMEAARKNNHSNAHFSISNGNQLPYASRYFDAVFHFGGINLFGDTRKAIAELERVCKVGGRVVFGDEGIAAHLRGTQYADIAINNNKLWSADAPLGLLPHNAADIQLNYILGNCFYVIGFSPAEGLPPMNIDIPHKGIRGGNARTRYFGQLEGVTEATKKKLYQKARESNMSVHSLLEQMIGTAL